MQHLTLMVVVNPDVFLGSPANLAPKALPDDTFLPGSGCLGTEPPALVLAPLLKPPGSRRWSLTTAPLNSDPGFTILALGPQAKLGILHRTELGQRLDQLAARAALLRGILRIPARWQSCR
jgi:hypothetical protein